MNDEFLERFHKTPRAAFADALYERISQGPRPRFPHFFGQRLTLRNAILMVALLFVVAACVYAVVERGWHKVDGFWINVENKQRVFIPAMHETPEALDVQAQDYGCMPLEEARKTLAFDLRVPNWAPEGFSFTDKVCGVSWISDFAGLYWWGEHEPFSSIQLLVFPRRPSSLDTEDEKNSEPGIGPVAPGSYQEVEVNGQPAILVRGDWDWMKVAPADQEIEFDFKWDNKLAIQLYWVDGNVLYYLYTRADVSSEDLIKMAESAR